MFFWLSLCVRQTSLRDNSIFSVPEILPYPVVFPELVFWEDGWGDVAPLMLFSGLLHCFLVTFLGLDRHIVMSYLIII